ncbi:DUF5683 domain-containing protein [Mangrovibacterium lignilyticum]|uniref:DUF5683 domain-containing protein n=1 Tax=Mangrovibacterium lignilyticum TaxID=2668052 RepID=UPI0013D644D3|nr:DUF5683 domain-containing protein [Mangrovibacterium lignilyticum]
MRHLRIFVLLVLFLVTGFCSFAQVEFEADTVPISELQPKHSPRKATIYSAVLPGLGQIYNKKYWKVPLIYGGFIGFGYGINWNNDYYVLYKQAYSDIVDDDPNTNSFKDLAIEGNWDWDNASQVTQFTTRLNNAKNAARRNRDFMIILTAAFYALNIIDATVDAHFFDFDIGDDLTFNWAPGPMYSAGKAFPGINVQIRF